MKLRVALRVSFVTVTVVAAVAGAVSGSLWLAVGLVVCAIVGAASPLAISVSRDDLQALLQSLRISQRAGADSVNSVVTSSIIFIARSAVSDASSGGYALLFRDEIDPDVWRELATLLRHQTHPSPELKNVVAITACRLGNSSDL